MNLSNYILHLFTNILNLEDENEIIKYFVNEFSKLDNIGEIQFHQSAAKSNSNLIPIQIDKFNFGFIEFQSLQKFNDDELKIITDAVSLLAATLKRVKVRKELYQELEQNKKLAGSRLVELEKNVEELQNARRATLNLIDDLTEEIKARRESEERFALAMRAGRDGLYDWNLVTNEIYYSPIWKRMLGYEDNELPNELSVWESLVDKDDLKKSWVLIEKLKKKQIDRLVQEFRMKHRDGHWVNILSRAEAIFDENDIPIRIVGTHIDITESKRAEAKIRRLSKIVEDSLNEIYLFDTSTYKFIDVNKAALDNLGYNFDELIQLTPLDIKPEISRSEFEEIIKPLTSNQKEKIIFETVHRRKDGTDYNVEVHLQIISSGEVSHFSAMIIDITQRKKAEAMLKESEEKYRSLFENQFEAYAYHEMIFDENKNPVDYRFIDVNPEFLRIMQIVSKEKLIGKTLLEIWPDSDVFWIDIYGGVALTGSPKVFERYDENLNKYFRVVAYSPKKGFFATSFLDVTERKLIENQLKESEEKFRTIVTSMDDIIYTLDLNEKHTGLYGRWTKELDFNADMFIGKTAEDIFGEEIGNIHHSHNQKAIKGETVSYEWEIVSNNIKTFYLTVLSPIRNTEEKVIGLVGVGRDITKLKDAEIKLRESESNYRSIYDNVQVGIYRTRLTDGKLIMANKKMAALFGYDSVEEAINKYFTSEHYVDPKAREFILDSLRTKGHFDNYEAALTIKSGEVRWFRYSGRLFDKEGYIEGVAIDITEQIEYQKELKRRNEFIQIVMDELPIGVALNRINDGFAFYINKKFEEIYGWPKEELFDVGNFFNLVYPEEEYRNRLMKRVMEDVGSKDITRMHWEGCVVTHQDGSEHIINAQNIPLYDQDIMVSTVIDVTAQKEYERKLKENEALLQAAFDNSQAGIVIADVQNQKLKYLNKAALDLIRFESTDKYNKIGIKNYLSNLKIYRTDGTEYKRSEVPLARAVSTGEIVREEFIIRNVDKSEKYVISHAAPINDQSGKRIAAIEVILNITERRMTEQKLIESELRYKKLVESSPDAIAIHLNNKLVFANPASRKLLQAKSLDDIIGLDVTKIVHPDCLNEVKARIKNIINKNTAYVAVEEKYLTLKGKEIDVEVTAVPIRLEKEMGVQVIIRDISDRKRAEERIIFERNRAENYLETAAMMMLAIDKNGKVMMINRKGAEILGYSKKYIIGKNWVDNFIPEKSRKRVNRVLKKTLKGEYEKFDYVENEVLCRYNKIKILGWHNSILKDEQGKLIGTLSSAEDITESLRMQKEIERSRKELQSLYQNLEKMRETERTELAREIHDDLGQSLTAIKIDLGSLKSDLPNELNDPKGKIDEIRSLVDTTINTVRKISTELRPGILDELGLSAAVEWQFDEFLKRNKMKGKLNVSPEEINLNDIISTAVFRVFQESLTNISRHSHAKKVLVNLKLKENQLNLTIKDDGVGIETEKLNSIKSLGLIGMRERINLIGGTIKILPGTPRGTRVSVTIPLTD